MNRDEMIKTCDERFKSGNDVPVESARITSDEWARIKQLLTQGVDVHQAPTAAYMLKATKYFATVIKPTEDIAIDAWDMVREAMLQAEGKG